MKKPKVSKEQQIEGLTFVLNRISLLAFKRGLRVLAGANFISKSEWYRIENLVRKEILDISWDEWQKSNSVFFKQNYKKSTFKDSLF
jgi:hypothetical protein